MSPIYRIPGFVLFAATAAVTAVCLIAQPAWAAPPAAAAATPPDGPEVVAARQAFNAKDYRGALQKIAEALSVAKGPKLAPTDRYALLMLRGEALLRLSERAYAIDAFDAASRAAGREHLKEAAAAKANAVLIRRSQGPVYKSARGGGEADGIPIVPPEMRPAAMKALWEDMRADNLAKARAALEGSELPPLLALVPVLGDMYVLEWTATGEPTRTTDVLKSFGQHARSLMSKELDGTGRRVESLSQLANSHVSSGYGWGSGLDRRGLWTPERTELQDLIDYVTRIRKAGQQARQIAVSFGYSGENWDEIIAKAGEVLDQAQEVWDHRY
jgi:hypothetical protein